MIVSPAMNRGVTTAIRRPATPLTASVLKSVAKSTSLGRVRLALVVLAMLVMTLDGLVVPIGGLTITPARALGLALLPLPIIHLLGSLGPSGPRRILWFWSGWFVVLTLSMLLTDRPAAHLVALISAALPICFFSLMTIGIIDGGIVYRTLFFILLIEIALGIPVLLIHQVLPITPAIAPLLDQMGRLKLLSLEPNLLGSLMALLLLTLLPRMRWSARHILVFVLGTVVLVSTLSKMPIVAFAIGLMIYGLLRSIALRRSGTAAVVLPLWLGGAAFAMLMTFLPLLSGIYAKLLDRSDAIDSRLFLYRVAVQRFAESPIVGRGPGDLGLQSVRLIARIGAYNRENLWIGQMALSILHDSGILGFIAYGVFLIALLLRALRWVRAGSLDHAGYVSGFTAILIASQATTAHLLPMFGIAAGLVAARPVWPLGQDKRPLGVRIRA